MADSTGRRLARIGLSVAVSAVEAYRSSQRSSNKRSSAQRSSAPRGSAGPMIVKSASGHWPVGDRAGSSRARDSVDFTYAPQPDWRPGPGEIVWAWVPHVEDASQGKDRPVLLVARDGSDLIGPLLTSKDHDRDTQQEAGAGRYWMDLGVGDWDSRGRPSEVRLNRIVRLAPDDVRREGAVLDEARFRAVVERAKRLVV